MKNLLFVALLSLSLLSCVSTATTVLNPALRRPPITPDKVVIYTSAQKVPAKYEEIAVLTSQGDYTVAGDDMFYESFRKEAAKIGANGVIITPIEDPTTGQKVGSAILGALLIPTTMGNRKTQALAIYVITEADELARQQQDLARTQWPSRVESLDTFVHAGMTRKELIMAVGPPTSSVAEAKTANDVEETATYVARSGNTFVVKLVRNIVVEVIRK